MVPVTKESQRAELHKTIWRIANDLRGSVDGWDFKSYVLGMLFYRYISENLTTYINKGEWEAGKSCGEYYTLQEVSELLARITVVGKTSVNRVYETFRADWIRVGGDYTPVA